MKARALPRLLVLMIALHQQQAPRECRARYGNSVPAIFGVQAVVLMMVPVTCPWVLVTGFRSCA